MSFQMEQCYCSIERFGISCLNLQAKTETKIQLLSTINFILIVTTFLSNRLYCVKSTFLNSFDCYNNKYIIIPMNILNCDDCVKNTLKPYRWIANMSTRLHISINIRIKFVVSMSIEWKMMSNTEVGK